MMILRIVFRLSLFYSTILLVPIIAVISYIDVYYFYPYIKKKYFDKKLSENNNASKPKK
jgi:NADH:ubiquinone oxidoreductase subunit 2 (subunit N)